MSIKLYNNPAIVNDFLLELLNENKSEQTIKAYSHDLNSFFEYIATKIETKIESITLEQIKKIVKDDITQYLLSISDTSASTRSRKVSSIKGFFSYLFNNKKIKLNPSELIKKPKLERNLPKYLSLDESKKLLDSIKNNDGKNRNIERDFAIITLFLNCGLRLNELINLDINSIKDGNIKVFGKGSKERQLSLNKACIKAINNYLETRTYNNNALFISENGTRIGERRVQEIIKGYLKTIGCDELSVHKLRSTFATLMYQHANVDIRELQTILGHSNIQTTTIYAHCNNEAQSKTMNKNPLND